MSLIRSDLERLWERIALACHRTGRTEKEITVVAVTKQVALDKILEAIENGVKEIGENWVQEAQEKFGAFPPDVRRHLVGHLQTNKIKKALGLFDMIQSLDSLKLAQEIDRRSVKTVPVLVEVNTSGEVSKSGVRPEETLEYLRKLSELKHLQILGLMTIGPLSEDQSAIRNSFKTLRRLFEQAGSLNLSNCRMQYLSMGMSSDFEIAIEEGSNLLRIGTAIFGPRN